MKLIFRAQNDILRRLGLNCGGRVQAYVDREVIRLCEPYVPVKTGALKNSAHIPSPGKVVWDVPYARHQYYNGRATGMRGRLWFLRMKANCAGQIVSGAQRCMGGGGG